MSGRILCLLGGVCRGLAYIHRWVLYGRAQDGVFNVFRISSVLSLVLRLQRHTVTGVFRMSVRHKVIDNLIVMGGSRAKGQVEGWGFMRAPASLDLFIAGYCKDSQIDRFRVTTICITTKLRHLTWMYVGLFMCYPLGVVCCLTDGQPLIFSSYCKAVFFFGFMFIV